MATPRLPEPTHDPKPRAPARKTGEHNDDDGQTWLEAIEEKAVENGPPPGGPVAPETDKEDDARPAGPHERIRTDHEPG